MHEDETEEVVLTLVDEVRARRSMPDPAEVRATLSALGISERRFATELGVAPSTIFRYLRGSVRVKPSTAKAIAELLAELRAVTG
jgi:predicted transcriptional regulator